ncbi:MAG: peptidoglycan-binding protein [Clostridiales bacterium]|nr:peptidoglycan-binding protein [Clostridiales bacterium]
MKKRLCLILTLIAVLASSAALACDHKFGPWKTKTSATCTRQEHQFRYCQKCDHWEQRRTAKLPHTPGEMTVTREATCTQTGRQETICQVCNNKVIYTINKLEHSYGEMQVTKEPTCTATGTGTYTCAGCGGTKRETLDKLGHDWGEMQVIKEPTCEKNGSGEKTCQRCDKVTTEQIDRIEHPWGEWTVTREPQGKRKGVRVSTCTMCAREHEEYFYWEGTLYEDMEACEEVIRMQEKLADLGIYKGNIRSGQFGSLTTDAVARFQKSVQLKETGVADPATLEALDIAWEKKTGKKAADTLNQEEMENADQAQEIAE